MLQKQHVKPLKKEQWSLHYPPTVEYVAQGIGPTSLKKKVPPPSHHIPALSPKDKPIFKLLK
jgi:hypothetical protein